MFLDRLPEWSTSFTSSNLSTPLRELDVLRLLDEAFRRANVFLLSTPLRELDVLRLDGNSHFMLQ